MSNYRPDTRPESSGSPAAARHPGEPLTHAALDALTAHLAILDEHGIILSVNAAWRAFARENGSRDRQFGEGVNYLHVCDSSDGPYAREAQPVADGIRAVLEGRQPRYEMEYPCHSPSEVRWFVVRITPLPGDGPRRVMVAHENITQRKVQEEALRESELRFATAFRANPVSLTITRLADGKITDANQAFLATLGYAREEVIGRTALELQLWVEPMERERMIQIFRAHGSLRDFEGMFRKKSGAHCLIRCSDELIELGGEQYILGMMQDITDRHRAEQALARESLLLRTVVDHLPDFIYLKDREGRFLLVNAASLRMMKLDGMEQTVGKTVFDFFPAGQAQAFTEDDQLVLQTGQPVLERKELITGAGGATRCLLTTKLPLRDTAGRIIGLVGISRDVTESQSREQEHRQAQKMESIGQLAGGIAHDFNNILTVIQGHAALMSMSSHLNPEDAESAHEIAFAAEHATSLTRQLLTFSRRQVMVPGALDLNEIVGGVTKMLRRVLGEDITLECKSSDHLPSIWADAGMMEQILINLSVNARDAMPRGGCLSITTTKGIIDETELQQNPEATPGPVVCLTVSDTGCGIAPENLTKIFEPFFTTKEVGQGTGLGLATVYGIVKQHQGWITVQSAVNHGTTFRICFPAQNLRAGTSTLPTPPQEAIRGGGETILLVEDERAVRLLVEHVLKSYGYTIIAADSGPAALQAWHQHSGKIDLLLTDMVMPGGLTGRELADQLRLHQPKLRIIFTSGYSPETAGRDLHLREGINYLQKPYPPRKLAQCVRDCLDSSKLG